MFLHSPKLDASVHTIEQARQEALLRKKGGWLRLLGEFAVAMATVVAMGAALGYFIASR